LVAGISLRQAAALLGAECEQSAGLEAVEFLKEFNEVIHGHGPGVVSCPA
jgi:hypothetical protein